MNAKTGTSGVRRTLKTYILACVFGLVAAAGLLIAFSAVAAVADVPHGAFTLVASIAMALGAVVCGFVCGVKFRSRGLFVGAGAGLSIFALFVLLNLIASPGGFGIVAIFKLLICALSGAFGGILGVNRKR